MLVQVIPLHLPAGDTSTERTVHIDGTQEQVEIAKQLVIEVTSEVRFLSSCDIHDCFVIFGYSCLFLLYQVNLNAGYSRLNKSHISVILEFLFASIHSIAQAGLLILEVVLSIIFSC